ncbi:hypothetical protein GQR58_021586 [Nymphon striatum]|nr:hypothetical protein GQR58_021586 [Nymphon striatum]
MKKINLKTFSKPVCKIDETTAHGKYLVLKADRNLFAHMLLVAQSRKLKIKDVLSHPLGPLSMALASPDGMMRTTNKSPLGHELQNDVYPAANIPQPCCCIIDGMVLVQKMRDCLRSGIYPRRRRHPHASRSDYDVIVVVPDDTDVLVLSLAFKPLIPTNMYLKCGTKTRVKYADITKVFYALEYELSQALVSFHAFTGCDTTSAFDGRGKLGPLKLLKSSQGHMNTYNRLREDRTLLPQVYENIKRCTSLMYNNQPGTYSVNELRYRLFCAKKGKLESHQIPPCADSLCKHYLQANYQANIWKSALQNSPDIPGPGGHGWKLDLSDPACGLVLDWVEGKPAPEIVLELLVCVPVQDYVLHSPPHWQRPVQKSPAFLHLPFLEHSGFALQPHFKKETRGNLRIGLPCLPGRLLSLSSKLRCCITACEYMEYGQSFGIIWCTQVLTDGWQELQPFHRTKAIVMSMLQDLWAEAVLMHERLPN